MTGSKEDMPLVLVVLLQGGRRWEVTGGCRHAAVLQTGGHVGWRHVGCMRVSEAMLQIVALPCCRGSRHRARPSAEYDIRIMLVASEV
jgi:hypothetical protein